MSDVSVDFQEALKGLSTTLRKAKDGELYVALTSDFGLTVQIGETDDLVRVLHPTSVMTLLERLNAEIRIPVVGDRVIGLDTWYDAAINHSVPRICKKKPKPEYRNLEIGEPVMPGDRLFNRRGESLGKAYNHYRRGTANVQGHSGPLYAPEAVSLSPETLQGLIDFAHTATHSINRYRSLHSYNMEYAKHWDDLKKLGKPSWDK